MLLCVSCHPYPTCTFLGRLFNVKEGNFIWCQTRATLILGKINVRLGGIKIQWVLLCLWVVLWMVWFECPYISFSLIWNSLFSPLYFSSFLSLVILSFIQFKSFVFWQMIVYTLRSGEWANPYNEFAIIMWFDFAFGVVLSGNSKVRNKKLWRVYRQKRGVRDHYPYRKCILLAWKT